jgi:hypothetical protein
LGLDRPLAERETSMEELRKEGSQLRAEAERRGGELKVVLAKAVAARR